MTKIRVCGFDPSMNNWGIAAADLDLETGLLDTPVLHLIQPTPIKGKQVRQNSTDLDQAQQLFAGARPFAESAKVIFAEVPVGSQNARSMASYGMCVGVLGSLRAMGFQIIEVTATEVKKAITDNPNATKAAMIKAASEYYPDANWPRQKRAGSMKGVTWQAGDLLSSCEHLADAIGAIHAGCVTPIFQNLMRLYKD